MPFVTDMKVDQIELVPEVSTPEVEKPTTGEVFTAAFREGNSFVSAASAGFGMAEFDPEEGYDPYVGSEMAGYEIFAPSFIGSKSRAETAFIKMGLDQDLVNRKTMADGDGWTSFAAQMAAGITDPLYLPLMFSGIGVVKAGGSAAGVFGKTAAIAGVAEIAPEAVKQATQEARTATEGAVAIGGAAILSGLLGAGIGALAKGQAKELAQKVDDILHDPDSQAAQLSVGAAEVVKNSLEDLELVNVGKLEQWGVSPQVRLQNSPDVGVRRDASALMESALVVKGNVEGKTNVPEGGAVETRVKLWEKELYKALVDLDDLYTKYRQGMGGAKRFLNDTIMRQRGEQMSAKDFRIAVSRSLRRGDKSDIPEVQAAAESMRKNVFDPLKEAAIKNGDLPKDVGVSTAMSYLTRMYNTQKIIKNQTAFDGITMTWLKGIRATAQRKVAKKTKAGGKVSDTLHGEAGLTDLELKEIATSIRNNITGASAGRLPYDMKLTERGPMKERTFQIPDKMIEDYLESDIEIVARMYSRTMSADVELSRMFGEVSGTATVKEIGARYERLINNAKTDAEKEALGKKRESDMIDFQAIWDRQRGTYQAPENPDAFLPRAGATIRDINFLRLLGQMTLSAIPDIARPIAVNGLMPVARGLMAIAAAPKLFGMAIKESRRNAVGLDMVINSRATSMADITDPYSRKTPFERGVGMVADKFGKISLMTQWNAAMRTFAGSIPRR